jgi:hypothetical protein
MTRSGPDDRRRHATLARPARPADTVLGVEPGVWMQWDFGDGPVVDGRVR